MLNRKNGALLILVALFCVMLTGCSTLQGKIKEYSADKVACYLNTENVTQFTYQSQSYTILEDTVSNGDLGDWIGYIRQLVAVDESGKILVQENMEDTTFHTLTDLADRAPDAAYILPFLNVYAAADDASYLIVDANGGYHKAVPSEAMTVDDMPFDYKAVSQVSGGDFEVSPDNGTQLLCNGVVYQVTSEIIEQNRLGRFLSVLAQSVTFDANTKKPLSKEELNRIDWAGNGGQQREQWFYTDVYEIDGRDSAVAIAVKVNNQYHLAEAQ